MAKGVFYITTEFPNFAFEKGLIAFADNIQTQYNLEGVTYAYQDEIYFSYDASSEYQKFLQGSGIVQSGDKFTAGTITGYQDRGPESALRGYLTDFSVKASALGYLAGGSTPADDRNFLRKMLAGDDYIRFFGTNGDNVDSNVAFFGAGNDTAIGYDGNDTLLGENGNDRLLGGGSNDYLRGGKGRDILLGQQGNDKLKGDAGDDRLRGGGGSDTLKGSGGDDNAKGGSGADRLNGNSGDDYLLGGSGNDTIKGGSGNDRLKGNGGVDFFDFKHGDGSDKILDFQDGFDTIRIREDASTVGVSVDYSGPNAVVSFLDVEITVRHVDNNSLTVTTGGGWIFLS